MAKAKPKRKPPRTQRDDLTCQVCGETYSGHVASRYCSSCKEERDAEKARKSEPPSTGSEMDVEAQAHSVPDRDPAYRKQIHVDPDRKRFDRRRRAPGDRSASRTRAADAIAKESAAERKRKDPLRARLAELRGVREGLTEEMQRLDQEILRVLDQIGIPAEGSAAAKPCFGRFDPSDFECTDLCPLRPECEVRAGRTAVASGAPEEPAS